eukprot:TRINITY_DN26310_c0_g1_i1.p1 TRINITY_DN26310_c0_g1~~TRINITY_DN26310_c0_g1_i1.p1  ORF type:complete len:567 (-),score=62.64 TRINITY_DN26310_c0_g1_i1:18-1718(-)
MARRKVDDCSWLKMLARRVSCICSRGESTPTAEVNTGEDKDDLSAVEQSKRVEASEGGPFTGALEWPLFESHLLETFAIREQLVQHCKLRRALHTRQQIESSLQPFLQADVWPYNAESLWGTRRDKTRAVGACALAVAVDLATTGASIAAASSAAAAASSATAAANTMKAWLFGFGRYGAAAAAAQASAAQAASRAAFFSAWSAVDAVSMVTMTHLSHFGVGEVAGMKVAHAAAVGAKTATEAIKEFEFDADAKHIKAGLTYRDVVYYLEGTVSAWNVHTLRSFSFQLRHVASERYLYCNGSEVGCCPESRSNQIWWALPSFQDGVIMLHNANASSNLFASVSAFGVQVSATAMPSSASASGSVSSDAVGTTAMSWRLFPGSQPGTVRLQNVALGTFLQRRGVDIPKVGSAKEWVECGADAYSEQDWIIVPKPVLYIGEFCGQAPCGKAQLFWPDGSPSFKGEVCNSKLSNGFVFSELGICQGRFQFNPTGGATVYGFQPEDLNDVDKCIVCLENSNIASKGEVFSPCGHGLVCEQCDWVAPLRECPFCGVTVESRKRIHRETVAI